MSRSHRDKLAGGDGGHPFSSVVSTKEALSICDLKGKSFGYPDHLWLDRPPNKTTQDKPSFLSPLSTARFLNICLSDIESFGSAAGFLSWQEICSFEPEMGARDYTCIVPTNPRLDRDLMEGMTGEIGT